MAQAQPALVKPTFTAAQIQQILENQKKLEAQNAALKAQVEVKTKITLKVSQEKKVLCIYGLQRRPVSLYASQALRLFTPENGEMIRKFIEAHKSEMAWKEGAEID